MPLGKELSHLVEEQIKKGMVTQNAAGGTGSVSGSGSNNGDKVALIEANVQRLAEQLAQMVSTQKKSKRNQIEYGLEVHALHGMRIAVTSGQATFRDLEEPLNCSFMYLELSPSLSGRQIRYIYLTPEATLVESTTEPSELEEYIPLAMVDIWSGSTEITEDKVQDIRPRANGVTGDFKAKEMVESLLTGNVTVFSTDTGKDSFVIRETTPPSMKVIVTSGRALVDGEVINAEGGELDLSQYPKISKEYVRKGDGETVQFSLFHQHVSQVQVFVDEVAREVIVDEESGEITFETPVEEGAEIRASYEFTGNCMAVFFVEKIYANTGKPLGIIGWAIGSNRTPQEPPHLLEMQHVIGKAELSDVMATITDLVIDNSYEVINLTQEELQFGEKLGSASLQDGAITAKKISANAIVGDHIAAGVIDAAKIMSGAIESQHISAGTILAQHIAANTITADMIKGGTISADKFESSTWGDLTQAIRYVKSILKGQNFWSKPLTMTEVASGLFENISYDTEEYPTLRLKNTRQWDPGRGSLPTLNSIQFTSQLKNFEKQFQDYFEKLARAFFILITGEKCTSEEYENVVSQINKQSFRENLLPLHEMLLFLELVEEDFEDWIQSSKMITGVIDKFSLQATKKLIDQFSELSGNQYFIGFACMTVGLSDPKLDPAGMSREETRNIVGNYLFKIIDTEEEFYESLINVYMYMSENDFFEFYDGPPPEEGILDKYVQEREKIKDAFREKLEIVEVTLGEPIYLWDEGDWDRPVQTEGWWESPSIDYGKQEDLQTEFWAKPLMLASGHSVQVQFKYSVDNLTWSDYEDGVSEQAVGYYYWIGTFQNYRYVKVRVEMQTMEPQNYEILAYPEVRIASATQGNVGDIRFPAMTVKPGELKLNGAILKRQDYPLLWTWACENYLVVSEAEWGANEYALRGLFTSGNGTTTFRMPDTRGYSFRVLPEGHTDDSNPNRQIGWRQNDAMQNATGGFTIADGAFFGSAWGAYSLNGQPIWSRGGDQKTNSGVNFNLANVVRTSSETRMKNIAYFACIRYS